VINEFIARNEILCSTNYILLKLEGLPVPALSPPSASTADQRGGIPVAIALSHD